MLREISGFKKAICSRDIGYYYPRSTLADVIISKTNNTISALLPLDSTETAEMKFLLKRANQVSDFFQRYVGNGKNQHKLQMMLA